MSDITWPKGSPMRKLRAHVKQHRDAILYGDVLVIDPASINVGYAVLQRGIIIERGTIEVDPELPIKMRLQEIANTLLEDESSYDVMAIERIRGRMAHAYLSFSIGAIMGSVDAPDCIEVPVNVWKAFVGKNHTKGDEEDAVAMAETLVVLATEEKE